MSEWEYRVRYSTVNDGYIIQLRNKLLETDWTTYPETYSTKKKAEIFLAKHLLVNGD